MGGEIGGRGWVGLQCQLTQATKLYGHNSPNYTMNHTDVQWDRIGPQATLLMPLRASQGPPYTWHS